MKPLIVARRELAAYVNSPIAYIVIALFLGSTAAFFFFVQRFFLFDVASMRAFFALLPWTLLFFVPPITMRQIAEERKLGTLEVLMTLPVTEREVITGKFLGAYALVLAMLGLTLPLTLTVFWLGDPDPGPIISGYVGAALLAGTYTAVGIFFSATTNNQVTACIQTMVTLGVLLVIGLPGVGEWLPREIAPVIRYTSPLTHFQSLMRGVIDTRDIVYYLSVSALFLTVAVEALVRRKLR